MSTLIIEPDHRQTLYYNQYQYCVSFSQFKVGVVRGLDQARCRRNIDLLRRWERPGTPTKFTADVQQAVFAMCDILADYAVQHPCKMVMGDSWVSVYSNDTDLYQKIVDLPYVNRTLVREALCTIPRDTILQKHPEFQYRVYFRERLLSDVEKDRLHNWLSAQPQDQVRGSPTLRWWLQAQRQPWQQRNLCQRQYYVDFQDAASITMLGLVTSGLIRNTCTIQARQ